jgi:hypothetical protein
MARVGVDYMCEDPNDALQRRMHEDMDTCAYTHHGMLRKTGAIEPPVDNRGATGAREPNLVDSMTWSTRAPSSLLAADSSVSLVPWVLIAAALIALGFWTYRSRARVVSATL